MKGDLGNYGSLTTCDAVKSMKPGNMTKSLEREGKERANLIQSSFGSSGINGTPNFSRAIVTGF